MSKTQTFRNQHDKLLCVASEISTHLDASKLSNDASQVRRLLSKLLGILSVHLSMEDKSLYPRLLEHSDARVRSMARKFIDEMGDIGEAVKSYKEKWPTASKIQQDPSAFIIQTHVILNALKKRIEKENSELYKTIDEL